MKFLHSSTSLIKTTPNNLSLSLSEGPKEAWAATQKIVYKKAKDLNSWYTRLIGLDEVKVYQDRVVDLQEKLLTAQARRREISLTLSAIRNKSHELQDQLHKVKRQEDLQRFLDLMREETEILRHERDAQDIFANCDREEREIFTAFTNAIRDSHEKQRSQLEYTKYFGLILSIVGSFLAFSYSSLRKNDLKGFMDERMEKIITKEIRATVQNNKTIMQAIQEKENRLRNLEKQTAPANEFDIESILSNPVVKYGIYALIGYATLRILASM